MNGSNRAIVLASFALILFRVLAGDWGGPWWSVNHLGYLRWNLDLLFTLQGLFILGFPLLVKSSPRGWDHPGPAAPAWMAALIYFLLFSSSSHVSTPLLGDGLDRIEAVVDGFKGLQGQPGPLDILIHIGAFKLFSWPGHTPWEQSWKMWQTVSIYTAPFAAALLWKFASLRARTRGQRWFIFLVVFDAGTRIFFNGYVENYVILTAAVYGFLLLLELYQRGRVPLWSLVAGHLVLIGLHFFMVLLLPATAWALHRQGRLRFSAPLLMGAGCFLALFGALVLYLLREYYGGVAAIFVSPSRLFGAYHLIGFAGQQVLACPAVFLLLPLAAASLRIKDDLVLSFTGLASLILLPFFFLLRPVIGPAADWDLFALPALFYTPWMVLRIGERMKRGEVRRAAAFAVIALTFASTGPWRFLNSQDPASIKRFQDVMDWEAQYNPWAASYGHLRLGKYLARRPWQFTGDPRIVASFLRAAEINPRSATVRKQAAELLKARGETEMAAIQMAAHHQLMGEHHEQKGDFKRAVYQYRESYALDAENLEALDGLIRIFEGPLPDPEQAEFYRRARQRARGEKAP